MKKALSLILALILSLSLTACIKDEKNEIVLPTEASLPETKEEVWVVTRIESINDEGDVFMCTEFEYNEDGELIGYKQNKGYTILVNDEYTYEYDFDEQNNISEVRVFADGKLSDVYTYNSDGLIIEITSYHGNGKQSDHKTYEYDEAGRLVIYIDYMSSGELDNKILYKYREDGTCEEHSCYEEDDVLLYVTECDEKGMPYFTQYYNAKAPNYSYKYVYDSYGNLTEKITYFGKGTKEQSHSRFTYSKIWVTPLQKEILEAKDRTSV